MRSLIALAAAGAALAGGAAQAASVEVKDAVARVTVIPEDRSDVKVEFVSQNPRLPFTVRTVGGRTIIDGNLDRRVRVCRSLMGASPSVVVSGIGDVRWDEMPQIVIRTPKDVDVEAGGAVFGWIGRAASVQLDSAGCGDWVVANVDGRVSYNQAGSGDARIGSAGAATLRVAGSGDIEVSAVRGPTEIDIAGSGDVSVASVTGPLGVRVAGSGDVRINGGAVTAMTVSIAGSGDVDFNGSAGSLKARIMGSGDVRAKAVSGAVEKTVMGSGGVTIG